MNNLHAHIKQLEQQILRLIARSQEQETNLQKLQTENEALKKQLQEQQSHKIKDSDKAAIGPWIQAQPKTQQPSLRNYIRTIDDCIAFLEKL